MKPENLAGVYTHTYSSLNEKIDIKKDSNKTY